MRAATSRFLPVAWRLAALLALAIPQAAIAEPGPQMRLGAPPAVAGLSSTAAPSYGEAPSNVKTAERAAADREPAPAQDPIPLMPTAGAQSIVLAADADCWMRIYTEDGSVLFEGTLRAGERHAVEPREGLLLHAGNARMLRVLVDGQPVPPLGAYGAVLRDVSLEPSALTAGTAVPPPQRVAAAAPSEAEPQNSAAAAAPGEGTPQESAAATASEAPQKSAAAAAPGEGTPQKSAAATASEVPQKSTPAAPKDPAPAAETADESATPPALSEEAPDIAELTREAEALHGGLTQPDEPTGQGGKAPAPAGADWLQPDPMLLAQVVPSTAAAPEDKVWEEPVPLTRSRRAAVEGAQRTQPGERSEDQLDLEINKGTLLRLRRGADTVFVADPAIADVQVKSPSLIYLFGKRAGETVLYAVDAQDRVLLSTTVTVTHNLSRLRSAIAQVAPDATVQVNSIDGAIILTGNVASPSSAEDIRRIAARFAPGEGELINQMDVTAPNQINLRVRVAEISRDLLKDFGFNWDALYSTNSFAFGIATGNLTSAGSAFLTRRVSNGGSTVNNAFASLREGNLAVDALVDALAAENLISILAEPNLTAMSGQTASFLAGGEFPVPVSTDEDTIKVAFKQFGVSLAFTPTILDDGRINLHVRPEVSEISTAASVEVGGIRIPGLSTRRAETTVELGSGQSFAVAGLLQNKATQDLSSVPGLGDMPVLGTLFRSQRFQRNETELVIIVTPYLVQPVAGPALATPLDGLVPPNDIERIIGGVNYRQQLSMRNDMPLGSSGRGLIGPAGFELE